MKTASDIYLRLNKLAHDASLEMSVADVQVVIHGCNEFSVVPYVDNESDKHIKYCLLVPEFVCRTEIPENIMDSHLLVSLINISWAQDKKFMATPDCTYYDGKIYQIPSNMGLIGLTGVWMYDMQQIVQRSGVKQMSRDDVEFNNQLAIRLANLEVDHEIPQFLVDKYAVQIEDLNRYIRANEFVIREFSSFKEVSFEE